MALDCIIALHCGSVGFVRIVRVDLISVPIPLMIPCGLKLKPQEHDTDVVGLFTKFTIVILIEFLGPLDSAVGE